MTGLYELLHKIKERPGLYLGVPSLSELYMFLCGYKFALLDLGIKPNGQELEFYREFQPWLQKKFQIQTTNSWSNIILLNSIDEREAFNYFFQLLEDFQKRDGNLEINEKTAENKNLLV